MSKLKPIQINIIQRRSIFSEDFKNEIPNKKQSFDIETDAST